MKKIAAVFLFLIVFMVYGCEREGEVGLNTGEIRYRYHMHEGEFRTIRLYVDEEFQDRFHDVKTIEVSLIGKNTESVDLNFQIDDEIGMLMYTRESSETVEITRVQFENKADGRTYYWNVFIEIIYNDSYNSSLPFPESNHYIDNSDMEDFHDTIRFYSDFRSPNLGLTKYGNAYCAEENRLEITDVRSFSNEYFDMSVFWVPAEENKPYYQYSELQELSGNFPFVISYDQNRYGLLFFYHIQEKDSSKRSGRRIFGFDIKFQIKVNDEECNKYQDFLIIYDNNGFRIS